MYSNKAIKPSREIEKNNLEHPDADYPFSKNINRLSYYDQIPGLFDAMPKKHAGGYYGKISGIEARIDFSLRSPCRISAKTEEDLLEAYKQVLANLP